MAVYLVTLKVHERFRALRDAWRLRQVLKHFHRFALGKLSGVEVDRTKFHRRLRAGLSLAAFSDLLRGNLG